MVFNYSKEALPPPHKELRDHTRIVQNALASGPHGGRTRRKLLQEAGGRGHRGPFLNPLCDVTFRWVVASLRGPGQSPVLPFACCVGSLLSVGRCGRCSCWWRFRVRVSPLGAMSRSPSPTAVGLEPKQSGRLWATHHFPRSPSTYALPRGGGGANKGNGSRKKIVDDHPPKEHGFKEWKGGTMRCPRGVQGSRYRGGTRWISHAISKGEAAAVSW